MPLTVQQRDEILRMIEEESLNINIIENTYLRGPVDTPEPLCALALKCNDEEGLEKLLYKMHELNGPKEAQAHIKCRAAPGVPESGMASQHVPIMDIVLIIDFERNAKIGFVKQTEARRPNIFFPGEEQLKSHGTSQQFADEIRISSKIITHNSKPADLDETADLISDSSSRLHL